MPRGSIRGRHGSGAAAASRENAPLSKGSAMRPLGGGGPMGGNGIKRTRLVNSTVLVEALPLGPATATAPSVAAAAGPPQPSPTLGMSASPVMSGLRTMGRNLASLDAEIVSRCEKMLEHLEQFAHIELHSLPSGPQLDPAA